MPEASFPDSPESVAFRAALDVVRAAEPQVADAISAELASQRSALKLIASENYASPAVLLAMGNWFSDKYAEGTAGRRLYAGCQNVDTVEELAAGHRGNCSASRMPMCNRIRVSTPTWWRSGPSWPLGWRARRCSGRRSGR